MALVDVSELLVDPDFVDPISLIYQTAFTNALGENQTKEVIRASVGCVQTADGSKVDRLPEGQQVGNIQSFWFKGLIETQNPAYPMILTFRGRRYRILRVFDWTNWGAGWSEGLCVEESLS